MVRKKLDLVGGRLCLDFVNTVSWRRGSDPTEHLTRYRDLLSFSVLAGAAGRGETAALRRLASRQPVRAHEVLVAARDFREALYRVLVAWRGGRRPAAVDIATINEAAPARDEIVWERGRFRHRVARGESSGGLERIVWPVAWSAEDFLVESDPDRLRTCGSDLCGWLFYDESRSQRRRWCSMSDCGNRAKARRHYARTRKRDSAADKRG